MRHITLEDLRDSERLDQLYEEATEAGILPQSDYDRLTWFAAAERALCEGKQNACGLFVAIYRKGLWSYVTHEQEDIARAKLKRLDFGEETRLPGQFERNVPVYYSVAA